MPLLATTTPTASVAVVPRRGVRASANGFPSFLPKEVERIRDPSALDMAKRIERLPVKVSFSRSSIMSSCVRPLQEQGTQPIVLLHGFDSSCLEWRYAYPLIEDAEIDAWAVDILGWGFSDLETLPSCNVAAKREHLFQHLAKAGLHVENLAFGWIVTNFWSSYIRRPMVLVGPSLGAALAIDFVANHPEAVSKLVLIDASVYAEGTGNLAKLPRVVAYAGVSLLKSIPLRLYATSLAFNKVSLQTSFTFMNVGRLHCLQPWWEDATVDFMLSGGYNVTDYPKKIKHKTLILWGEEDQVVSSKLALRLHHEVPDSALIHIPGCGHLPHVEKPELVVQYILKFLRDEP